MGRQSVAFWIDILRGPVKMRGVRANSDKESGMALKNNFPTGLNRWLPALLGAGVLLMGAGAQATTIVSPNKDAAVEGNLDNVYPFNIGGGGVFSLRYQQVYLASDFAALSPGGEFITQIAFRPDGLFAGSFATTLPSIRIDLSTSHARPNAFGPNALSTTFANNVGANDTIVYGGANGAALPLSSAFTGPVGGPKAFDIIINLTTPFFYDPAAGNLLLDVRNFGGGTTTEFDAQEAPFNPLLSELRVYSLPNSTNGVDSATGGYDDIGLVTQFTITPAPEPGTMVLFGIGSVGLIYMKRSSRRREAN
jgi:hypothetical protein